MAGYLGNIPSAVPLTSADIADGIISSAKIADGTIVNADINASSAIAISKIASTGTSLQVLRMNSGATALEFATVSGTTFGSALLHVRDEKTANTHGGTSTSATTHTRTLNTVKTNEISGASLASDTITLPSGTYFINAFAPSYIPQSTKLRLRNSTDSSYVLEGISNYANTSDIYTISCLFGRFTIASTKNFQIHHFFQSGQPSNGLGQRVNEGTEVYTDVMIWKVA